MSRIDAMKAAIDVWKAHPFFGVGMGTENFLIAAKPFVQDTLGRRLRGSQLLSGDARRSAESSPSCYTCICVSVLWRAWRSTRRLKKSNPEFLPYPRAIQLSMMAYLICSFTQPRYTFDFFYMIVMYAAVWHILEKSLVPQRVPASTLQSSYPRAAAGAAASLTSHISVLLRQNDPAYRHVCGRDNRAQICQLYHAAGLYAVLLTRRLWRIWSYWISPAP